MSRYSRELYIFQPHEGQKVEFAKLYRVTKRELEVVLAPNHYRLSSWGFTPPLTLSTDSGEILKGSNAVGLLCNSWKSEKHEYRVIGRRADWIIGAFHAFHIHADGRRVGYWDQPKRFGDIRGVFWNDYPAVEIATIVFGSMYDWDKGDNWVN